MSSNSSRPTFDYSLANNSDPAQENLRIFLADAPPSLTNLTEECTDLAYTLTEEYQFAYFNACLALSNVTFDLEENDISNSQFIDDIAFYGIEGGTAEEALAEDITSQISSMLEMICGQIACDHGNNATTALCTSTALQVNASRLSWDGVLSCQDQICDRIIDLVTEDSDIGGIGVLISYTFQIVMVLFFTAYLFIKLFHKKKPNEVATSAFTSAVVNFQKTQCWFISTLVIAAFIRLSTKNVGLLDLYLLLAVTTNGIALLSATLLIITYLGSGVKVREPCRSWYNYALTVVSFILCFILQCIGLSRRRDIYDHWSLGSRLCHNTLIDIPRLNQIDFFLGDVYDISIGFFIASQVYCILVITALVAHRAFEMGPKVTEILARHRASLLALILCGIAIGYLFILGLQCFLLAKFYQIVDSSQWGFGQIIATTVWLPILADYIQERSEERAEHKVEQVAGGTIPEKARDGTSL